MFELPSENFFSVSQVIVCLKKEGISFARNLYKPKTIWIRFGSARSTLLLLDVNVINWK